MRSAAAPFYRPQQTRRFAVFGRPIAHSLSPQIHQSFAGQRQLRIDYQRIECADEEFEQEAYAFARAGGVGFNITTPFKELAFGLSSVHSSEAGHAKAVNTIRVCAEHKFEGHNTDGLGLCRDLKENLHIDLESARVLLLGAGSVARAVALALARNPPRHTAVFNRSPARLRDFLRACLCPGGYTPENAPVGFDESVENQFDLIVNCASAALDNSVAVLPDLPRQRPACLAYDLSYGRGTTAFMRWAGEQLRCRVCDGIGMLVEQAAFSFVWWNGEPMPSTRALIQTLARAHSACASARPG